MSSNPFVKPIPDPLPPGPLWPYDPTETQIEWAPEGQGRGFIGFLDYIDLMEPERVRAEVKYQKRKRKARKVRLGFE